MLPSSSATLENLQAAAQTRLATILPYMLIDQQAEHIADMQDAGWSDDAIRTWAETQLPASYREFFEAAVLDIAEEVAARGRSIQLRAKVLAITGMADAPAKLQDQVYYHITSIAQKRLRHALPEMLSKEQLRYVDKMLSAGKSDFEISEWIKSQLPQYGLMMEAIILDVAEEDP